MIDSNCFSSASYQIGGSFGVIWISDLSWTTERHSGIKSNDIIPTGIPNNARNLIDTIDIFRFPFCAILGNTPELLDQNVPVNVLI